MGLFRDIPIARKLTLLVMVASSSALMLMSIVAVVFEIYRFRQVTPRDLTAMAELIAANSTAPLAFRDAVHAQENLASLKVRPEIRAAWMYDKAGALFARYVAETGDQTPPPAPMRGEGHRFTGSELITFSDIRLGNEVLGSLCLQFDLRHLYTRMTLYLTLMAVLAVASSFVALLLASRLQRLISAPIMDLSAIAHTVTVRKDYSKRAQKLDDDELGQLVDSFNEMLHQIEQRDQALNSANTSLLLQSAELENELKSRRAAEERFRQLAENISEVFWMTNTSKSEMIYISPAYEKVWGRSCDSVKENPRSWMDTIHPEDRERVLRTVFENQVRGEYDEEYRIVRPDGTIRWIRDRAFPVRDEKGSVYRLAGIAEDITERKQVEESLRLQARVLDSMLEGVVLTDEQANIVFCNRAMEQMFGYDSGELTGKHCTVLNAYPPEENKQFVARIVGELMERGSWTGEVANKRKDGTPFTCQAIVTKLELSGKTFFVSVQHDITEQKRIAEELWESERRFRTLATHAPVGIFQTDSRGLCQYVNNRWVELTGMDPHMAMGRGWMGALHHKDRDVVIKEWTSAIEQGRAFSMEYRFFTPPNRVTWVYGRSVALYNKYGQIEGYLGTVTDVTARRVAEEALRDAEQKWRALQENSNDLVIVMEPDGVITSINRPIPDTGPDKVVGQSVFDLVAAEHESVLRAAFETMNREGHPQTLELLAAHRGGSNGEDRWFDCHFVPIRSEGRVQRLVVIATDITDRKRLERELLEVSDREQRRIGQDLHDGLCQHLTGTAFAGKVLEQRLSALGLPEANDARRLSGLVTQAIEQARSFSRGLSPVALEEDGLVAALHDMADNVQSLFDIRCHLHSPRPVLVPDNTTATHLYRIAQEAVNNAIRHAKPSNIAITLEQQDDRVLLTIDDDGVGLPEKAGNSKGMGLHIMSYRARMVGGTVTVKRRPEGGTRVSCEFDGKVILRGNAHATRA
jgi:PAS domain S-box-containing protein